MSFSNKITDKVNRAKASQKKSMTINNQRDNLWRGIPAFLILSLLSEGPHTSSEIGRILESQKVWHPTPAISKWMGEMLEAGLLSADWDGDANKQSLARRKFQLTPLGWAFLSETEKLWEDIVQKVFRVTKKKISVRV